MELTNTQGTAFDVADSRWNLHLKTVRSSYISSLSDFFSAKTTIINA